MKTICLALAFAILCSACGQKGALYLPSEADQKKSAPRKTEEGTIEK
jgi:predicted small lipoprotein YifL